MKMNIKTNKGKRKKNTSWTKRLLIAIFYRDFLEHIYEMKLFFLCFFSGFIHSCFLSLECGLES